MNLPSERISFQVGETASLSKEITLRDIETFASISGDNNPIHLDKVFAEQSIFKGQIAHGMLVAGLISAVLGTKLPGIGTIYRSQSLRFKAPVYPGDTITVTVKITEWNDTNGKAILETKVVNQRGELVVDGEANIVMASFISKK